MFILEISCSYSMENYEVSKKRVAVGGVTE